MFFSAFNARVGCASFGKCSESAATSVSSLVHEMCVHLNGKLTRLLNLPDLFDSRDHECSAVSNRQKPLVKLGEIGCRVYVLEQIRMEPLSELLQHDEVIW